MQVFVLNSNLRADTLLDGMFTFRWTEKYSEVSDFEIEVPATSYYRSLLKEDTILMIDESDQPMIIETVKLKKSGKSKHWIVQGRDLTSWMELRVAPWDWSLNGYKVSAIALSVITRAIINPPDNADRLPSISVSNNATDGALFDYESTNDDLLSDVQNILADNNCAIRCDRIGDDGSYSWRYRIYNGTRKNVRFSDKDDTLIDTQYIRSKKKWRNVANVRFKVSNKEDAPTGSRMVYANGGSGNVTGLNRRVIRVDATNLNPNDYPGTRFNTALDRRGRAELSKLKRIEAIEGQIPAYTSATYGKTADYYLGDIVKFGSDATLATEARVTAFTWSIDQDGFKKYPTIDITADTSV